MIAIKNDCDHDRDHECCDRWFDCDNILKTVIGIVIEAVFDHDHAYDHLEHHLSCLLFTTFCKFVSSELCDQLTRRNF